MQAGEVGMRNLAVLVMVTLLAVPAGAQELVSEYTDVDIGQCTMLEADEMGAVWACPGLRGYPVMIAEGDLRFFVSLCSMPMASFLAFDDSIR